MIVNNLLKSYSMIKNNDKSQEKVNISKCVNSLRNKRKFKKFLIYFFSQKDIYNYKLKSFTETETLDYIINFNTLKNISIKNFEPSWIFQFRKNSLSYFYKMNLPSWSECKFNTNDFSKMIFYSACNENV
mmetsp:Transcript_4221/g.8197  ORF Transcript_4221/g.8197 Transcript_4221/m.8197 type:complete len:130 (+) Transcript_4221:4525-4914(+)